MASTFSICLCLAGLSLCLRFGGAANIDSLIGTADIYYQIDNGQPHELRLRELQQLKSTKNFKVIVHGFIASRTHSSIMPLYNAYMALGADNILLADWEDAAHLDYVSSRGLLGRVAIHLAKILQEFMRKHAIDPLEIHIIGHSLGAHIAGCMGTYFNGTLGRVTGLDPALPLFAPNSADSLNARAAQFIDVIHTDYPVFGDFTPRGSVDFYPNFGHAPQPGCGDVDLFAASKLIIEKYSCSHNLAVLLYAESVGLPRNFPAVPCALNTLRARNAASCLQNFSGETVLVYMGDQVNRSATGFYYLQTHEAPPYGFGKHMLV